MCREREQFLDYLQTHCSKLAVTVANGVSKKVILQCDLTQGICSSFSRKKKGLRVIKETFS